MPNILIVGTGFKLGLYETRDRINEIMVGMGKTDAITTFFTAEALRCHKPEECAPYLVVRDSERHECVQVARLLHQELNVNVEIEVIDGFLAAKDEPTPVSPNCDMCGKPMFRYGSGFKCLNCGATQGCS